MAENYSLPFTDNEIPRRGFIKSAIFLLNAMIALVLAIPGLGYLLTPVFRKGVGAWVKIGALTDFNSDSPQKATFNYTASSGYTQDEKKGFVWVVQNSDSNSHITVLSAVCTHTGCNVAWDSREDKFVCPCHEGRYDVGGNVVSGPPPKPLAKLSIKTERGQLLIRIQA